MKSTSDSNAGRNCVDTTSWNSTRNILLQALPAFCAIRDNSIWTGYIFCCSFMVTRTPWNNKCVAAIGAPQVQPFREVMVKDDVNSVIAASVFSVFLLALLGKYNLHKCTRREWQQKTCILITHKKHNKIRRAKTLLRGQIKQHKTTMPASKSSYTYSLHPIYEIKKKKL